MHLLVASKQGYGDYEIKGVWQEYINRGNSLCHKKRRYSQIDGSKTTP